MNNPFESIEARLNNIESLLLDIKHNKKETTPNTPEDKLLTVPPAALSKKNKASLKKQQQLKTVLQYLKQKTATASMISSATGIPQKNICRYKRELEKDNLLWQVYKAKCKITGFRAWYLTTAPQKKAAQLKLF